MRAHTISMAMSRNGKIVAMVQEWADHATPVVAASVAAPTTFPVAVTMTKLSVTLPAPSLASVAAPHDQRVIELLMGRKYRRPMGLSLGENVRFNLLSNVGHTQTQDLV